MAWRYLTATVTLTRNNGGISEGANVTYLSGLTVNFTLYNKTESITYIATAVTNSNGVARVDNTVSAFSAQQETISVNTNGGERDGDGCTDITVSSIDPDTWMASVVYNGDKLSTPFVYISGMTSQTLAFVKGQEVPKGIALKSIEIAPTSEQGPLTGVTYCVKYYKETSYLGKSEGYIPSTITEFESPYQDADTISSYGYYERFVNGTKQCFQDIYTGIPVTSGAMRLSPSFSLEKGSNGYIVTLYIILKDGVTGSLLNGFSATVWDELGNTYTSHTNGNTIGFYNVQFSSLSIVIEATHDSNQYQVAKREMSISGIESAQVILNTYTNYTVVLPRILDTTYLDGKFNLPNTKYELYNSDMTELVTSGYTEAGSACTCYVSDYDNLGNYLVVSKNHYKDTIRRVMIAEDSLDSRNLYFAKIDNGSMLTHMTLRRDDKVCMVRSDLDDYINGFYDRTFNGINYFPNSRKVGNSDDGFYTECMSHIGTYANTDAENIEDFKKRFVSHLYDDDNPTSITTRYIDGRWTDQVNEERYNYIFESQHCYVHERSFIPELDVGPYLTFEVAKSSGTYHEEQQQGDRSGTQSLIPSPSVGSVMLEKIGTPYDAAVQYRIVDVDHIEQYIVNDDWDWHLYTYGTEIRIGDGELLQFRRQPFKTVTTDMRFSKDNNNYYHFITRDSKMNVYGYVNTLLDAENNVTSLLHLNGTSAITSHVFYGLFKECANIDTEGLILNANTLSPYCYSQMFMGCTGIENAPFLRENDSSETFLLAANCCESMFYDCSSMTMAPTVYPSNYVLPYNCFATMFRNCRSISNEDFLFSPPGLGVNYTFYSGCCASMFAGCTNLKGVWFSNSQAAQAPDYAFHQMFKDCTNLIYGTIFEFSNVKTSACESMFENCENVRSNINIRLVTGSTVESSGCKNIFKNCYKLDFPQGFYATTIGAYAYSHAFENAGISSTGISVYFHTGATTASQHSYAYMFYGANINNTPYLALEEIPEYACEYMFSHSTIKSIVGMFNIALYIVGDHGCSHMFDGCTHLTFSNSLQTARTSTDDEGETYLYFEESDFNMIRLNATRLGPFCYEYMFANCTNLSGLTGLYLKYGDRYRVYSVKLENGKTHFFGSYDHVYVLPHLNLPATELSEGCYYYMFMNCTNLDYAISLSHVTTLADYCCQGMYMNCGFKNIYPCLTEIRNIHEEFYTTWWQSPDSDVPCFNNESSMLDALKLYDLKRDSEIYDITNEIHWVQYNGTYFSITHKNRLFKNGMVDKISTTQYTHTRYRMNLVRKSSPREEYYAYILPGSCEEDHKTLKTGLIWGHYRIHDKNKFETNYSLSSQTRKRCFYEMFKDCKSLTSAINVKIDNGFTPTLAEECCAKMFEGCTNLLYPPQLDNSTAISTAGKNCYYKMFSNCKNLLFTTMNSDGKLHATTLDEFCYASMYSNCVSLTNTIALPATTLAKGCYHSMFYNCQWIIYGAPSLSAQTLQTDSYAYMFSNAGKWRYSADGYMYIRYKKIDKSIGYASLNVMPQEVISSGNYVHISEETKVYQYRQNGSASCSVSYPSMGNLVAKTPSQSCLNASNWYYDHYYRTFDEQGGWFKISYSAKVEDKKEDLVTLESLVSNLSLKATISQNDHLASKIVYTTNTEMFVVTSEPSTGSFEYINSVPGSSHNQSKRYINTHSSESSFLVKEDGHRNEHQLGITEIKSMATNAGTATTSNWVSELEHCENGKFYKKSGSSWPSGYHGIPTSWDVETL